MEENKIDKLFRDALYNMEQPVDAHLWGDIQRSIRASKIRRIFYWTSSVAAVIILGLFLLTDNPQENISIKEESHLISENILQQPVEVAVPEVVSVEEKAVEEGPEQVGGALQDKKVAQNNANVDINEGEVEDGEEVKELEQEAVAVKEQQKSAADAAGEKKYMAQAIETVQIADEPEYVAKKRAHKFAVSSNFSTGRSNTNSANSNFRAPLGLNGNGGAVQLEQVSEVQYSLPLNVGLQVQFPIRGFISMGLGLNYSMLVSKYDALLDKQMVNVKQTLHYMGIPANLYFKFLEKSGLNFYGNAGIALEWGLGSSYNVKSYNFNKTYSESNKGVLFSLNAGLGVEYVFADLFGLYLEPNVVYYPNSKVKRSIRTDQPVQIRAEIGCRFHF